MQKSQRKDEDSNVTKQTVPDESSKAMNNYVADLCGRILSGEVETYVIVTSDVKHGIDFASNKRWQGLGLVKYYEQSIRKA